MSFRKDEVESPVAKAAPNSSLAGRVEALERAHQAEILASTSLNMRATALAVACALAILLVAQFSGVWLDDGHWQFSSPWDTIQRKALLPGSILALVLCLIGAVVVLWPQRRWGGELKQRLEQLGAEGGEEESRLMLTIVDSQRVANERKARFLRIISIPLGLAVSLVVAQSMVFAFDAESVDRPRGSAPAAVVATAADGLPEPQQQLELAEAFAPIVYLHPDESFGPADPNEFIAASRLGWNRARHDLEVAGEGSVDPARLGGRCGDTAEGCYSYLGYLSRELTRPFTVRPERPIELQGAEDRGFFLDPDNAARTGDLSNPPSQPGFFQFRTTSAGPAITYWFFYAYSQPRAGALARAVAGERISHEGDWESIDVVLSRDYSRAVAVHFYGHGRPQGLAWTDACKVIDEVEDCRSAGVGHPIVYAALGSHASYPAAGENKLCTPAGCACDLREPGLRWVPAASAGGLRPVEQEPWYGFGGAWGAIGDFDAGPLGPSTWKLPANLSSDLARTEEAPC